MNTRSSYIRAGNFSHPDDDQGFENSCGRNLYACSQQWDNSVGCGSFLVTVNIDEGITPKMATCPNCGREAWTDFGRIADWLETTHEWYRPETLDGLTEEEREDVENGVLLLRPIGGELPLVAA